MVNICEEREEGGFQNTCWWLWFDLNSLVTVSVKLTNKSHVVVSLVLCEHYDCLYDWRHPYAADENAMRNFANVFSPLPMEMLQWLQPYQRSYRPNNANEKNINNNKSSIEQCRVSIVKFSVLLLWFCLNLRLTHPPAVICINSSVFNIISYRLLIHICLIRHTYDALHTLFDTIVVLN